MSETIRIDNLQGNLQNNEAGGNITQAQGDVVGRDKIEKHIHIHRAATPSTFRSAPDPSYLAYLLDRVRQEAALLDTLSNHQNFEQPLICVIRGRREDCCSDAFAKRIANQILPKIPHLQAQLKDNGCDTSPIRAEDFHDSVELHRFMRISLADRFVGNKTAPINEICQKIHDCRRPVLLYQTLSLRECYAGADTIRDFLKFWSEQFRLPAGQRHLVLVCLFFYQEEPRKSWLGFLKKDQQQAEIEQALADFSHCAVLEKLESISESHLHSWMNLSEVQDFFKRPIDADVRRYLAQHQPSLANGIPLENLADTLLPLLKQLAQEVPR